MDQILQLVAAFLTSTLASAVPPPEPCFAPGTSAERILEIDRSLGLGGGRYRTSLDAHRLSPRFQFNDGSRWSFTATDGFAGAQGVPITLTWSVVPDGTPIPPQFPSSPIFESSDPSGLRAFLNGLYGSEAVWQPVFEAVFDRLGELTGITYVYEPNDDGASFPGSGGVLGVRGDVRIGGHPIDGNFGILAYNFFPNNGDMVIDVPDSFYNNLAGDSIGLRNVLAHEHGHGLGISHVCPINGSKLMEPFLSTAFDGPQHDDIQAASRGYGDRFEDNDAPGTASTLGALGEGTTLLEDLSIDDNSDVDYYSFSLAAGTLLDLTLTPIGESYLSGPQGTPTQENPSGCTAGTLFDSLTIHDLSLAVLDESGTTELASTDDFGAGVAETLTDLNLGAGTFLVEVVGAAANAAQLYRLSFATELADQLFVDGFESGDTSSWTDTEP